MTEKAIEVLSKNKKGFILMVEGSEIDFAGHAKDINGVTSEVIDLDQAVGEAYKFAKAKGNTLVIVTADHETGGLTLPGGDLNNHKVVANFGGTGHTAVLVPVFSFGPGAEKFSGIHENTFFFNQFVEILGLMK
jgi:alkaline phosphatase